MTSRDERIRRLERDPFRSTEENLRLDTERKRSGMKWYRRRCPTVFNTGHMADVPVRVFVPALSLGPAHLWSVRPFYILAMREVFPGFLRHDQEIVDDLIDSQARSDAFFDDRLKGKWIRCQGDPEDNLYSVRAYRNQYVLNHDRTGSVVASAPKLGPVKQLAIALTGAADFGKIASPDDMTARDREEFLRVLKRQMELIGGGLELGSRVDD